MILPLARSAAALALMGLTLAACHDTGGSTTAPAPARTPAEETMNQIPLGAPPGQAVSLAVDIHNPFEGDPAAVQEGKQLFAAMNCVYCHGAQASGLMGPALDAPGWRYGGTPAEIYNSIHDGRPKGMPAWGGRLPPDQIWKLVAYIESLGGAAPPATPAMAGLAGAASSTTGPEPAEQQQTDTAHQSLVSSEPGRRR